jgi:hypothetical protein
MEHGVRFRPSRVEGVADVDEVCISRDRLEIRAAGQWLTFPFLSFARGREISSGRVPVGELHFSNSSYPDSHFVFHTAPRIAIYMPVDGPTSYPHSHFWRVQEVLREGGFRLYEGGPPRLPPPVLDPRPARTVAYVAAAFAFAWLYGLSGFLPGWAGDIARDCLLSNPRNPAIGLAFMLPALAVPIMLAVRHGRTRRALAAIIAISYLLALASEWALRHAIHPWAPLERPPFNWAFWSPRHFMRMLLVVTVATLVAATWRRAYLEPIPESERSKLAGTTDSG